MSGISASVDAFLRDLEKREQGLASCPEAANLRAAARTLDDSSISATSRSMLMKSFNDTVDRLRSLAPPDTAEDAIDKLHERAKLKLVKTG